MGKRRYTKIREIVPEIMAMREAGKTQREIAEHFRLEKKQLKAFAVSAAYPQPAKHRMEALKFTEKPGNTPGFFIYRIVYLP